ncbi:MAG TPA: cytochrome c [Labilithrix sp.]|nr:cytochrome c [Labilithrix sp.]
MIKNAIFACSLLGSFCACVPKRDLPPDQIQKLERLDHVMDVQATIADPQFGKIGNASFTDDDWTAFADLGNRIQVTSRKTKEFSKGPEFDALADQLGKKAEALTAAASTKDAKAASSSLADMKSTCKSCHSKFR